MATLVLTNGKLYAGAYDFSGDLNSIALDYAAEMLDRTVFGDTTRRSKGGLKTVELSAGGLWDTENTNDPDPIIFTNIGVADTPVTAAAEGAEGDIGYSFKAALAQYAPAAAVGELLAFEVTASATGLLVRGTVMHTNTRTSSANGTGRQLGAVSATQKVYAALHVVEASGTSPTLTANIQSDDNSGFTSAENRITFTQATGITSEWKELAGAITDDWWRITWLIGGTNPSFRFIVLVAIQ